MLNLKLGPLCWTAQPFGVRKFSLSGGDVRRAGAGTCAGPKRWQCMQATTRILADPVTRISDPDREPAQGSLLLARPPARAPLLVRAHLHTRARTHARPHPPLSFWPADPPGPPPRAFGTRPGRSQSTPGGSEPRAND